MGYGRQGPGAAAPPLLPQAGHPAGHGCPPRGQGHRRHARAVRRADDQRAHVPGSPGGEPGEPSPLPARVPRRRHLCGRGRCAAGVVRVGRGGHPGGALEGDRGRGVALGPAVRGRQPCCRPAAAGRRPGRAGGEWGWSSATPSSASSSPGCAGPSTSGRRRRLLRCWTRSASSRSSSKPGPPSGSPPGTSTPARWRWTWRRRAGGGSLVFSADRPEGTVHRAAYVFCVLEQFHLRLRRRDIFATASTRWADPRAKLLSGPAWETARAPVLNALQLPVDPDAARWRITARDLDDAWRQVAGRLDANAEVSIDAEGRLHVGSVDAVVDPPTLKELRRRCEAHAAHVDRAVSSSRR